MEGAEVRGQSQPVKVFCSHRRPDKPRVSAFARRLRADGIDAWLDGWEIGPGDDVVQRINRGLDECQVGLVFLSSTEEPGGRWMGAEVSTLTHDRLEGRLGRVIPVLLDAGAPVPALLRALDKRSIDDYDAIRDAILGHRSKPPLGLQVERRTTTTVVLRLYRESDGTLRSELREGNAGVARAEGVTFPPGTALSLNAFMGSRGRRPFPAWVEAEWRLLETDLAELGRRLGRVLFAGEIGGELAALLQRQGVGEIVDLVYEADAELLSLPVEAARLAQRNDAVLALEPPVRVRRRPLRLERQPQPALAHPLKILVAVAAPTHGQGVGEVLDSERELHTILSAVEEQARLGRAEVRVLEVASLERLGTALERDAYHVVHLSGHGRPGAIALEDEDGAAVEVDAPTLVGVLGRAGMPVPLLMLSSCHSAGSGPESLAGFAASLVTTGLDRVVAMQTRVTDRYATAFAAGLYRRLASHEDPVVGAAVAQTRQELEQERRTTSGAAGELRAAEYATATLLATGEDRPIVDHAADAKPLRASPVHQVHRLLPQLTVDEFIGRRDELREVPRVLRDDPGVIAEAGRMPGVVLTGVGGLGKSALAGRIAARLVEEGWALAVHQGQLRLDQVAGAVAEGLGDWADRLAQQHDRNVRAGQSAAMPPMVGRARATADTLAAATEDRQLVPMLMRSLQEFSVLLMLDDFEQNLTTGGEAFSDEGVAAQLDILLGAGSRAKLLVTSRYPLPGFEHRLRVVTLPPLSSAEIRKNVLRLPGLRTLAASEQQLVSGVVGGHPRVLELLDALLRQGSGRQTVLIKLSDLARQAATKLRAPGRELQTAISEAIELGAQDILLDELLALLDPSERWMLDQIAPSNLPISPEDLAALVGAPDAAIEGCERLADLSLLMRVGEGGYWVQRWMAHALRQRDPAAYGAACHALAAYRLQVARTDPTHTNVVEALRNWSEAHAWDEATTLMLALANGPFARSQLAVSALATEVLQDLPPDHANFAHVADLEAQADLACGFTMKAWTRYRQLAQLLKARAEAEAHRADHQGDLSFSYDRLGDLAVATGRGEEAARLFTQALDIRRRLAEAVPDCADHQRNLSVSHNKLGELAVATGRGEDAAHLFTQALDIRRLLTEAEPDSAERQRDLSISYERLGELARARGRGEEAARLFSHALDIHRRLAEAEPDRADYQRDLSVSYHKLGDLARDTGRGDEATRLFTQALDIHRRLAEAEPDRADYQCDLSLCFERLAGLARAMGRVDEASRLFSQALDIRRCLAAAEPDRADYQRNLSVSYQRLGDLARDLGRDEDAARLFTQALDIQRRLTEAEPARADYQRDLSVSHDRLGDLALVMGRIDEASRLFTQALDIRRRLAEAEPDRADYQRGLSVSYQRLGDLAMAMGHGEEAAGFFNLDLDIARCLAEADPDRADYQRDLSVSYNKLASYFAGAGDTESAQRHLAADLEIARRLAAHDPTSADAAVDVAVSLIQMASFSDDPARERGEARAILGYLRAEGRLPPHGERLLANLEEEPGTGAHP